MIALSSTYCYPGTNVLINKFGFTEFDKLNNAERNITAFRMAQLEANPVKGNFNLAHLQAIHKHIFQDVYDWAGKVRTVNISKGNTFFANSLYIKTESDRIFNELKKDNYLKGLGVEQFSEKLAYYASDINVLHPFREGNGRSTREYLRCLSQNASYELNYSKIPTDSLYNAFVQSVTDTTSLKNLFKDHFIQNTREAYPESYIKNAPEDFICKLNDIRLKYSKDGHFLTIAEIKGMYKEIGKMVDGGSLSVNDEKVHLFSGIVNELRVMNVYTEKDLGINEKRDITKAEMKKETELETS